MEKKWSDRRIWNIIEDVLWKFEMISVICWGMHTLLYIIKYKTEKLSAGWNERVWEKSEEREKFKI